MTPFRLRVRSPRHQPGPWDSKPIRDSQPRPNLSPSIQLQKGLEMNLSTSITLAAAAMLCSAPAMAAQGTVEVGSKTSYTFNKAPINGMGVKSLKDLRGKPVLIEFWGTH